MVDNYTHEWMAIEVDISILVSRNLDEGTNLYTDEAPAYQPLDVEFQHSFVTHAEE